MEKTQINHISINFHRCWRYDLHYNSNGGKNHTRKYDVYFILNKAQFTLFLSLEYHGWLQQTSKTRDRLTTSMTWAVFWSTRTQMYLYVYHRWKPVKVGIYNYYRSHCHEDDFAYVNCSCHEFFPDDMSSTTSERLFYPGLDEKWCIHPARWIIVKSFWDCKSAVGQVFFFFFPYLRPVVNSDVSCVDLVFLVSMHAPLTIVLWQQYPLFPKLLAAHFSLKLWHYLSSCTP